MHRPIGSFTYPYKRHALVHHRIFKSDHTYHLINEKDKETIPMAWWNGPALVAISSSPFVLASFLGKLGHSLRRRAGHQRLLRRLRIHALVHASPRKRHVERSGIFFRLNGHHLLHHRYMNRNYNVVLPLADLCFGTLLLRSKVHFKQASGPSVPNVQPKQPALGPPCAKAGRRLRLRIRQ
jgi:sterol desaturase/sphingolipid hydroxylase (fatty acid hydroxylase superfamily)